jgi:hypothetical protein
LAIFSSVWMLLSFPNMLGTPRTAHKLSMCYCYVCRQMAGTSNASSTSASLTFQLPAMTTFQIHPYLHIQGTSIFNPPAHIIAVTSESIQICFKPSIQRCEFNV